MLKNCWECVMGSRVENEVYGTVLNGSAQTTAWPESHRQNEIMFRLPRPLKDGDMIEISGVLRQNPERLLLSLTTGTNNPDYRNIACQLQTSFSNNNFIIRGILDGQIDSESTIPESNILGQFPDLRFNFIITVREMAYIKMDISLLQSFIGTRELNHNLEEITFLTLDGDVAKIEELKFTFG